MGHSFLDIKILSKYALENTLAEFYPGKARYAKTGQYVDVNHISRYSSCAT
jgi:hypothetical protein